jgi:hypothetical protein
MPNDSKQDILLLQIPRRRFKQTVHSSHSFLVVPVKLWCRIFQEGDAKDFMREDAMSEFSEL